MPRSDFGWVRQLTLVLTVALSAWAAASADAADIDFGDHPEGANIRVGLAADRAAVTPGGQLWLAVVLDHAENWHSQPRAEELNVDGLVATTVNATAEGGQGDTAAFGPPEWPEAHMVNAENLYLGVPEIPVYEGRAVIRIPVILAADLAPGDAVTFTLDVGYQICDDYTCEIPTNAVRTLTLPVVEPSDPAATATPDAGLFDGADPSIFADAATWAGGLIPEADDDETTAGAEFFGVRLPAPGTPAGLAVIALASILGGFILNLTPCVLPVIPIKVMTLSSHAGSPGKSLVLGLWMALGVVAFWLGIGIPAAFVSSFADPSIIFGTWWITLGIGVLIAAMGVGIMGAFAINLPKQAYMINPQADSPQGSFMFGVMTGVLGLPCFGFVAGALLPAAAALSQVVVVAVFLGIGIGMALPYLVLAAKPSWVDKIPRTGPASELVKQVMGLLLLAAAAFFIGAGVLALVGVHALPWWGKVVHWWVIGVLALASGLWLITRTLSITPKAGLRAAMALVALVIAGGGAAAAARQTTIAYRDFWVPFENESFETALAAGDVVVLDFTAEWCLNCKALEAGVLLREPVKGLLLGGGVVPVKADLTSKSAPGWPMLLDELGQKGIPTLAVFGPGLDRPWISNAYTSDQVVDAIDRARGGG